MLQTLLVGAAGAVIATAISQGVALAMHKRTLAHQTSEANLADARALRDARRDRIRANLASLLGSALAVNEAAAELNFTMGGETIAQRDARVKAMLEEATAPLIRARVELMLEPETTGLVDVIDERVFTPFRNIRLFYEANAGNPGTVSWEQIQGQRKLLGDGVEAVRELTRQAFAMHDEPILGPVPKPWRWPWSRRG